MALSSAGASSTRFSDILSGAARGRSRTSGTPEERGRWEGGRGGLARGGSSESQRSGSTDPAPGPKCLGLPRWGIRRRRGFIPRRVTREGGTWRREGRGRRREGGGGRPSAERAPRTMCGRRRPRDRPPAVRRRPRTASRRSVGRATARKCLSAGPHRARTGPRGAREEPPRHRAARTPRPGSGRAEARRSSRRRASPGSERAARARREAPRGRAAGRPGDGLARAAPAWNFPLGCRPPPGSAARRGSSPRPRPAGPGPRADPRWGWGGQEAVFPALCGGGRGRGGAGPLAGLRRVGEGRLAHPASPYKEGLRAGVRLDHSNEQFAWQQASYWPSGESLRGGGGAGTVAARRREGTWGCGRGARTERGAKGSGGRVALVPQSVPAHPYDCLPSAGGWRSGALRAPCESSAPKLELRAAGRSSAAVRQRPQRSTKPRAPCGAPRLLPGQPGPPAACRL